MNDASPSHSIPIHQLVAELRGAGQFLIYRNLRDRELVIMPKTVTSHASEPSETFALELLPSGEEPSARVPTTTSTQDVLPIRLKLHGRFVEQHCRTSSSRSGGTVQLVDTPAAQLAMGLLSADLIPEAPDSIVFCMLCMLRERIVSLLDYQKQNPLPRFQDWQLAKLAEVFAKGTEYAISITAIASLCGLSTCHFSRLFKATYGMPFRKHQIQERIKRAQIQLSRTDEPISQIALSCGFADQSCFTRCFSATTGMPPAAWRRNDRRCNPSSTFTPRPFQPTALEIRSH